MKGRVDSPSEFEEMSAKPKSKRGRFANMSRAHLRYVFATEMERFGAHDRV